MTANPATLPANSAFAASAGTREKLLSAAPNIHCLTNAVTMRDVANILLAVGGSAIMAQAPAEVAQITQICQATLLNTGTPSDEKFTACRLAGEAAGRLGHPIVLDPVGAGASTYRQENLKQLLSHIRPSLIRCNFEEALTLLAFSRGNFLPENASQETSNQSPLAGARHGGVESGMDADLATRLQVAAMLAKTYHATILLSGGTDAISDGRQHVLLTGGDARIAKITGSGCMLSALCAAFLCAAPTGFDAAVAAASLWKQAATDAAKKTDQENAGLGSFYVFLFDAASKYAREPQIKQEGDGP